MINAPVINGVLHVIEGLSTGIARGSNEPAIVVHPNPASDRITITIDPSFRNVLVSVFDLAGMRVLQGQLLNGQLVVSGMAGGSYVLVLGNGITSDS